MTLLNFNWVLTLFSFWICISITTAAAQVDQVLQYPYYTKQREERSNFEDCSHFPYGRKPHVKIPAHVADTIEKNITVKVTTTVKPTISTRTVTSGPTDSTTTDSTLSSNSIVHASTPTPAYPSTSVKITTETITETHKVPNIDTQHLTLTVGSYWDERNVFMHVAYVNNPLKTLSVYEPLHDGTCMKDKGQRANVQQTSQARGCVLAVNAGLFNTSSGKCYGNIISDGRLVQDSDGIQNAHFGITQDGELFFGYLSEIDIVAEKFHQLVGGVIWILKDGETYVDESIATECQDTEETGSLERFASVVSARTIVANDEYGRVMIVQIDGKTDKTGASLYEAADMLKKLGAVNAINLDGGGSSTLVINNTLANYPSDWCDAYQCMRNVTTVLCAHEPFCEPRNCSNHGTCDQGICHCHGYWTGSACDILLCPKDCYGNGRCTEDGCKCNPGYKGDNCSRPCDPGWHGNQCLERCTCEHGSSCNITDGSCQCVAGYTGKLCQYRCPFGSYGDNCSNECSCPNVCECDHVTGSCNSTLFNSPDPGGGTCLVNIQKETVERSSQDLYISAIVSLAVVAAASIIINLVFLWKYCSTCRRSSIRSTVRKRRAAGLQNGSKLFVSGTHFSSFTSSTTSDEETSFIRK